MLYAGGILVSGLSMFAMMLVKSLGFVELGIAGFVLGAASGFFWTNRYLLTGAAGGMCPAPRICRTASGKDRPCTSTR